MPMSAKSLFDHGKNGLIVTRDGRRHTRLDELTGTEDESTGSSKDAEADADSIKKREERMLDATFGDVDESMMDEDRKRKRQILRDIFSMVPWTPLRGVDRR